MSNSGVHFEGVLDLQTDLHLIRDAEQRTDLLQEADGGIKHFIDEAAAPLSYSDFLWLKTTKKQDLPFYAGRPYKGLVNLHRMNDVKRINKFLEKINRSLETGSYVVISLETKEARKLRIFNKYPRLISRPYYAMDFIFKRFFPKWSLTKRFYFWLTKGKNRVLSLTEGLGRLVSCGYKVIDHQQVGYTTWVIAQKVSEPEYNMQPTYGALVKLKRIGYKGKMVSLYKMRTMHPYSEYLQEYIYEKNGTANGDKIIDDFRVTRWGKLFRKLWIDELPMLWNYAKRDLKLVGVRPLSEHKFYTYPEDLQKKRVQVKPGLVPPFYADLPETVEEFYETEERYLDAYLEHPVRTDIRYFFKAMYNIFIKRARSA